MRWKNKQEAPYRWHKWFAWHPVDFLGGNESAFLEMVWRRKLSLNFNGRWIWQYIPVDNDYDYSELPVY
jgi:hypothetical protein